MSGELRVEPQVLVDAAAGITAITGVLADLGIGETAASGRGFSLLALSPLEAGHRDVQTAFEDCVERWSWGVRYLVQAANSIARTLDLNAGRYHDMEQAAATMLKTVWSDVVGDPHLSEAEIAARGWGETLADNPINHVRSPDYSVDAFAEAYRSIGADAAVVSGIVAGEAP
ncbi:WXG100 family type VII secretion target [Rhodococcus sp. NPDC058532]|uniref:WXG100 family type VII secretion target n=1 Tax=Rhodococcus sp. NPDC058532 TaxID=3346540 RepID=UPI0036531273